MNAIVDISNDCNTHWVPELSLCEEWLEAGLKVMNQSQKCNISLRFVENAAAAELNKQYRGRQSATNVLSFPAEFPASFSQHLDFLPLGDIVICPEIVKQEAKQQNKELQSHWAHLLIHGLLHLAGFDHDTDEGANSMEALEINALKRLGFPNPYLIV